MCPRALPDGGATRGSACSVAVLPGLSDEEIDQAVRQALVVGHSFRLFMQPKIRLADGRCDSPERLLRFPIDERTWISPLDALAAVGRLGCDHAQGYLYAPALAHNAFIDWYRARHPGGDQPVRSIVAR